MWPASVLLAALVRYVGPLKSCACRLLCFFVGWSVAIGFWLLPARTWTLPPVVNLCPDCLVWRWECDAPTDSMKAWVQSPCHKESAQKETTIHLTEGWKMLSATPLLYISHILFICVSNGAHLLNSRSNLMASVRSNKLSPFSLKQRRSGTLSLGSGNCFSETHRPLCKIYIYRREYFNFFYSIPRGCEWYIYFMYVYINI